MTTTQAAQTATFDTMTTTTCEGGNSFDDFDGSPAYMDCTQHATTVVRFLVRTPLCVEDEGEQAVRLCADHATTLVDDAEGTLVLLGSGPLVSVPR